MKQFKLGAFMTVLNIECLLFIELISLHTNIDRRTSTRTLHCTKTITMLILDLEYVLAGDAHIVLVAINTNHCTKTS